MKTYVTRFLLFLVVLAAVNIIDLDSSSKKRNVKIGNTITRLTSK